MNRHPQSSAGMLFTATAAIFAVLASGCANVETRPRLSEVNNQLLALQKSVPVLSVELVNKSGLSEEEVELKESEASTFISGACIPSYSSRLGALAQEAANHLALLRTLPTAITSLDAQLAHCASEYDSRVKAFVGMEDHTGRVTPMVAYFDRLAQLAAEQASLQKQLASTEEEDQRLRFAIMAGVLGNGLSRTTTYTNPSQSYVGPYLRKDGSVVQPYLRTHPNSVCFDNINGCR